MAKVLTELAASCTLAALRMQAEIFGPEDHIVLILGGGNTTVPDLLAASNSGAAVEDLGQTSRWNATSPAMASSCATARR